MLLGATRREDNTLQMSIIGGGAITLLATFAGYVFARIRFPGRNFIFFAILFLLPLPIWVSLNPLYFIMSSLGLVDTKLGLLLRAVLAPSPSKTSSGPVAERVS